MIYFPALRTRRFTLQLKELSIGESISLAAMPVHLEQATCTAFLKATIKTVSGIEDPLDWTVQERTLAVCHYLSSINVENPNFSVGTGAFFDYFNGQRDFDLANPVINVGEIGDDNWSVRHLTGAMAETIERLSGEVPGVSGQFYWLLGCMAAQLIREGEIAENPDAGSDNFDEFLLNRMRIFSHFPTSDFTLLLASFYQGRDKLQHFFDITVNRDGIIVLPMEAEGTLPPARFRARSCVSRIASSLGG